jgi:hypothetical protein
MTVYLCVKCKKTWEKVDGDCDLTPSGTLCKPCLKESLVPIYRKRQFREKNFDCFGKASGYCDQSECKYRDLCLMQKEAS